MVTLIVIKQLVFSRQTSFESDAIENLTFQLVESKTNRQIRFQGRRKLFYWGAGAEQKCRPPWLAEDKKWKKHWLKLPKVVPHKTKFGPNYKWFNISYLEFFFSKYCFYICLDVPVDIIRVFFISDFPAESLRLNKN